MLLATLPFGTMFPIINHLRARFLSSSSYRGCVAIVRFPVDRKAIENMEQKEKERIEERQARIDNVMAVSEGGRE